jgi:hypothetical protein
MQHGSATTAAVDVTNAACQAARQTLLLALLLLLTATHLREECDAIV